MNAKICLLTLLAGAGGGALMAGPAGRAQAVPAPRAATAPRTTPAAWRTGTAAAADLETHLELTQLDQVGGSDVAKLQLSFSSHFPGAARAVYVFETRDDHGKLVGSKVQPAPFDLPAGGTVRFDLTTGHLPNGFYRASVNAVAKSGAQQGSAMPELYLESRGGRIVPLDFTDFAERSAYNTGIFQ